MFRDLEREARRALRKAQGELPMRSSEMGKGEAGTRQEEFMKSSFCLGDERLNVLFEFWESILYDIPDYL